MEAIAITNSDGFVVSQTVTFKQFASLMVSFIESGDPVTCAKKGGWCWSVTTHDDLIKICKEPHFWYAEAAFWAQPNVIVDIRENHNDSASPDDAKQHLIGHHAIAAGLAKLAASTDYRHHLADLIGDNDDAATADIVMQFICLGGEVYA